MSVEGIMVLGDYLSQQSFKEVIAERLLPFQRFYQKVRTEINPRTRKKSISGWMTPSSIYINTSVP